MSASHSAGPSKPKRESSLDAASGSAWLSEPRPTLFNETARSLALLAVIGASIVLGLATFAVGGNVWPMLARNALPRAARSALASCVLGGALVPPALVLFALRKSSALDVAAIRKLGRAASPLIPLAFYPLLFQPQWARYPLEYLVCLAGFALLLERCLSVALVELRFRALPALQSRTERWSRAAPIVVSALAAAYAAYTGYLTILNHHRFLTGAYDLGIYDNLMYNALDGHPFRSTVLFGSRPGNSLSTHAEYGMLLFLPFYAMHPSAEAMLVIQSLMLGGAAIPLYFFAATQLPKLYAALLAIAYLLFAPLAGPQFYDFHWLPLAMFFDFLLYWAIARRKNVVVALCVLALFSLREDTAPGVAVVGFYLMLSGARPKLGAILTVLSLAWFGINKFVIMPALGSWWFDALYKDLMAPGESGGGSVVKTLLTNPIYVLRTLLTQAKFEYALHLLAPLAFLPLRRPKLLLFLIPGALFTVLTTDYAATTSIRYQYPSHWIPYLFLAAVLALRMLRRCSSLQSGAALATLCAAVTCHSAVFGAILNPSSFSVVGKPLAFSLSDDEKASYAELEQVMARIPKDASVTTTDFETPHLSNRATVYAIGQDDSAGQYLLVHARSIHLGATKEHVLKLLHDLPYRLVTRVPRRVYLFERGEPTPETAAAIREISRL